MNDHNIRLVRVKTRGNRLEGSCSCKGWEIALNSAPEEPSPEREIADRKIAAGEHRVHTTLVAASADILANAALDDVTGDIWLVSA